jgi:hypothetical protein
MIKDKESAAIKHSNKLLHEHNHKAINHKNKLKIGKTESAKIKT